MPQISHDLSFEIFPAAGTFNNPIDVVVPFTTPELTRRALAFAEGLSGGIAAEVRFVRVQLVPFPAPLEQSPVAVNFLKWQMMHFHTELPYAIEICLSREMGTAILDTLKKDSVVVLASRRRPWTTHQQRLAAKLEAAGHKVILILSERT